MEQALEFDSPAGIRHGVFRRTRDWLTGVWREHGSPRVRPLASSLGGVLFLPDAQVGSLLVVLTLFRPALAWTALAGLAGSLCLQWLSGVRSWTGLPAPALYNPVLSAMVVGSVLGLSPLSLVVALLTGFAAAVITRSLEAVLSLVQLPVLSLPFALAGGMVQVAVQSWRTVPSTVVELAGDTGSPLYAVPTAWLKAWGSIFFQPDALVGAAIMLIVLYHSRLLVFTATLAWTAGLGFRILLGGDPALCLADPWSFNLLLVGMALPGTCFSPGLRTLLLVPLAAMLVIPVQAGCLVLQWYTGIPPLVLPFNLVVLLLLLALRRAGSVEAWPDPGLTPEESITRRLSRDQRFRSGEPAIALPLDRESVIMQGFNGPLTHQGPWGHALDFVCRTESGTSFAGTGTDLRDYPVYGTPVLAPVTGEVIAAVDGVADNAIGSLNAVSNWGNFLIIRSTEGFYLLLAHLQAGSLTCLRGQWVRRGQVLAAVGNSGYSLYPHLHLQVQSTPCLGDPTIPFNLEACRSEGKIVFHHRPGEGESLRPLLFTEDGSPRQLLPPVGTTQAWQYVDGRGGCRVVKLTVRRTPDRYASPYLEDEEGDRLYFQQRDGLFTAQRFEGNEGSPLRLLAAALPRYPVHACSGERWRDSLALDVALSGMPLRSAQFRAGLGRKWQPEGEWRLEAETVSGTIQLPDRVIRTRSRLGADGALLEVCVAGAGLCRIDAIR